MLRSLRIKNIALIEELDLSFDAGFSVLTGETGAGKSIIIEAFNFVLGERASRELIRSGAAKASVEASFSVLPNAPVRDVLLAQELELEDDELVLSRELTSSGKNVCRVNGTLISTAALKQIGDQLVDIHGQHEHQSLLDAKRHLSLLDRYALAETAPLLKQTGECYARAQQAQKALRDANIDERERAHRLDLFAYQMREIDAAQLQTDEEEQLLDQRRMLQNAQSIMDALETASACLSGEQGALAPLSAAMHAMVGISKYHADYASVAEKLNDGYYAIEDLSYTVRDLRSAFSYDPEELNRIEERLELISRLKRKYGGSIEEILAYRERIGEEYALLSGSEERQEALERAYAGALADYCAAAEQLSAARRSAAGRLSENLLPELRDLGMPHASFDVRFSRLPGELPSPGGVDDVEFLLSANRGEPLKSLSRVASGGEISRVMLAFKRVLADTDGIATMVFDEIDSGISGQIGNAVAQKMRQIARSHQVLCITHLPQIAACAQAQYHVFKRETDGKTVSSVVRLDEEGRCREIARIMGSSMSDPVALQHARQLLSAAQSGETA